MVKLTVLYGTPTDPAAFDAYYFGTHAPLADKIPGIKRNEVSKASSNPDGSAPPFYLLAELYFDNAEALMGALGSDEGHAAAADVPNFATGSVTMTICDVVKEV